VRISEREPGALRDTEPLSERRVAVRYDLLVHGVHVGVCGLEVKRCALIQLELRLRYLWGRNGPSGHESDMMGIAVLAEVIGAMIGIPSLVGLFKAKSRTVRLDWAERTISIRDGSRTRVIPMADVAAVELDCHHQMEGGRGSGVGTHSGSVVTHYYNCEVRRHWRDASAAPAAATLVETGVSSEADGPYRRTLPLVTELARSLGVERRVTDYDVRRPKVAAAS